MTQTLASQPALNSFCEQDHALLAGVWIELMARTAAPEARCRQLFSYAQVLIAQGRDEEVVSQLQECVATARQAGLTAYLNQARSLLGQLPLQPAEEH